MEKQMFGEFVGTMILILMGNGAVANVLLRKSKGADSGWMVITSGWAFAVMIAVFCATACGSAAAHLNPAVTLGVALHTGDFHGVIPFCVAQLLGALTGQILVWLHYLPHWAATPEPERKVGCFCTSPAIRHPAANLITEAIGTFVLVFAAGAIGSKAVSASGLTAGLGPLLVGSVVWGIGLSLGGTTGYAINPARDLGPRIAHSLLPIGKKASSDWSYAPIPIVGPLIGGGLAGLAMKMVGF